ncbi:MAG: aminoglycoside phosphotransferase family protein [Bryobacteraceae bacterium]|nr:aminoglycoside phosphotransferase family protein [Bryobacteraceae bacterium]
MDVTFPQRGQERGASFVAKRLWGRGLRELNAYRALDASGGPPVAPRLLGVHRETPDEAYLFLEWIPAARRWPWVDEDATSAVIRRLAQLHTRPVRNFRSGFDDPNIEREIEASAAETAALYHRLPLARSRAGATAMGQTIDRVAGEMSAMRAYLKAGTGIAPLHGDVHSGNVVIRAGAKDIDAVLLDWGRARLGSPLEDVSSWLQSLALWEPRVKRRHDTLLKRYIEWSGPAHRLDREFRRLYWLAAASNAMAGALRYHLAVTGDKGRTDAARNRSAGAARDWLRIIRRADKYWRQADGSGRRSVPLQNAVHRSATP